MAIAIEFLAKHLLNNAGHAEVSTDPNLQEKTEEEEFSIGPLSVLYNSVKSNSQVRLRIGKLIFSLSGLFDDWCATFEFLMKKHITEVWSWSERGHLRPDT
jgi:hypothetical protein